MKNTTKTLDMTNDNPSKMILLFSIPMFIGNIFQQLYNLADSMVVGRVNGANALAAVGASGAVSFLFFSIAAGIAGGAEIVASQAFGSKNTIKLKKTIVNTAILMFISALIMSSLAFIFTDKLLILLNTPKEIFENAALYMKIQCIGVPMVVIYNFSSAMLRSMGDSRTPLYFLIITCILNVLLDILFVWGLGLGVFGAAVATILSQMISGVGCLIYAIKTNPYFKIPKSYFKYEKEIAKSIIKIGIPLALQYSLIAISCTVLQGYVNRFGAVTVAAFTVTGRIEQLIQSPLGSLGAAMGTYSGQNHGAKKDERVIYGYKKCLLFVALFSFIMLIVMQLFGEFLVSLFVNDIKVITMGGIAMKITSIFYFFLGLIYVTRGLLNGVGDAFFTFINGAAEVTGRIFIPLLLVLIPSVGSWGIWWATGLTWFITGLICVLRLISWKNKVREHSFVKKHATV